MFERVGVWHSTMFCYIVDRMRSLDEGNGSLLDNSLLMYGSSLRDGNRHSIEDLPLVLAGKGCGMVRPGRRLTAPPKTPLCNLYRTLAKLQGIDLHEFGDSTGLLSGLA